ncbi:MAG: ROK family protein [Clostridia bacterium]|nr:ROK family protein [Clostridia bacterium]
MYRIGVDLGGTNIAVGVVDENYNIIGRAKRKTNAKRGAESVCDDIAAAIREAAEESGLSLDDIASFGIGTPGSVDTKNGIIKSAGNLQFFDVNLKEMLKERLGKDFTVENDGNAAAYGEYIAGAGKGTENFIAITLGTGVGGGIVIGGKIYTGSNFAGAELGHMIINMNGEYCTCGKHGCFEAYASATALIRQTIAKMNKYPDSVMWELCGKDINNVNGKTAFDANRMGDKAGKETIDEYISYLATGVSNIISVFQPDVLCIGGGISGEGEALINPVANYFSDVKSSKKVGKATKILAARLGNDAGIIGAAYMNV